MSAVLSGPRLPEYHTGEDATSHEVAYRRLRHALMVGAIAPGDAITIQQLTDELGVSATPVREALRQLGSENALTMLKNRRIRVPEMTRARFDELVSLRCNLEVYAARQALAYVNNILIDELERIDFLMDDAVEAGDWEATVLLNQQFHSGLYLANPGQLVMPMIESLWLQLGPILRIAARRQREIYMIDHHKDILVALRANDGDRLATAIEADIRDGIARLDPEVRVDE